uniref:Uncharacterized protein n=2 Tax=Parascaris univalens TaxID=6257 RepID=A0A914ZC89_PARUN
MLSLESNFMGYRETTNDEEYFFGEEYRGCCGWLHVVWAAKLVIVLDAISSLLFLLVLPLVYAYLDALCISQLCVSITVIICAFIDICKEGRNLFWPFISYKCVEVIACSLLLIVVIALVACGSVSRRALHKLLRYRFRSVSEANELGYISLSVIALCAQIAFSCIAAHTAYSAHSYFCDKAIRKYIDERKDYMKYFL